jgi:hypothetical protein
MQVGRQVPSTFLEAVFVSPIATGNFYLQRANVDPLLRSHTAHPTKSQSTEARGCSAKMAGGTVRRPSYKDVLQPALHRRFTTTGLILSGVAYAYAILLGRWNSCGLPTTALFLWWRGDC